MRISGPAITSIQKSGILISFATLLVTVLVGCETLDPQSNEPIIAEDSSVPFAIDHAINLEQGWSEEIQQAFYFRNQGSRIIPYDWFLYLERPNNENLFRDNRYINELRYLPSTANKWNPDGLPVGFAKDTDKNGNNWVGLTCAACHTSEIAYKDTNIRIDGAPTMGDFENFNKLLVLSLSSTYKNEQKFNRFAKNVLKDKYSDSVAVNQLRHALLQQTEKLAYRNQINHSGGADQPHYGFGRVDAIGAIFNQIMVQFNNEPSNVRPSDAPASYPFLWGTHQSDVVQWTGFAPNGPMTIGALVRNGEKCWAFTVK